MFLYTDVIIGNLFIRAIKEGITSLSFFDIYNFFYYMHKYLSHNGAATMVMGGRDDIDQFIALNADKFKVSGEKIDILEDTGLLEILINNYQIRIGFIVDAFDYAFSKIL